MSKFVHCSVLPMRRRTSRSDRADAMAEAVKAGVSLKLVAEAYGVSREAVWKAAARRQIFTKGRGAANDGGEQ